MSEDRPVLQVWRQHGMSAFARRRRRRMVVTCATNIPWAPAPACRLPDIIQIITGSSDCECLPAFHDRSHGADFARPTGRSLSITPHSA